MAPTDKPAPSIEAQTFHVGTRQSMLARVQTNEVVNALKKQWPQHAFEIHAMATKGDNNQRDPLHKFNEKALWTQELEIKLQEGGLDLIVHSLKDMPTQLPNDLSLGGVTERHDPRDALVVKPTLADRVRSLGDLEDGSVVGTSSLRRIAQLRRFYPNLKFTDVRGSIGTRLAKLDNPDSEYSAICIAVAGLDRLGMGNRITAYLTKDNGGMLHAVGQGGLGIEIRKGDARVKELLDPIIDERSLRAALAERSIMRTLEGGCSVPIGVESEWVSKKSSLTSNAGTGVGVGIKPAEEYHHLTGVAQAPSDSNVGFSTSTNTAARDDESDGLTDELSIRAIVVSLDGKEAAEVDAMAKIGSRADADEFGHEVARQLVEKGADKILQAINLNREIIEDQNKGA